MSKLFAPAARRIALAAAIVVLTPLAGFAERVALVIGNSDYTNAASLANPRNDAEAIASKLRSLGFTVVDGYDLGVREIGLRIRDFARASRGAEMAVVFYAGHGMQVNGENYLVPVDAVMQDETAIDFELIPVSMITDQFDHSDGAHLLFLDACSDNPLAGRLATATGNGTRSASSGGLAPIEIANTGTGTGIAFATSPGMTAADGQGRHSPFTEALLANIGSANMSVSSLMNRVTADVLAATEQTQRPWFTASFTEDVYFNRVAAAEAAPAPTDIATDAQPAQTPDAAVLAATAIADEDVYWDYARSEDTAESYQIYLDRYPNGRFALIARSAIESRRQDAQTPTPAYTGQPVAGYTGGQAVGFNAQPVQPTQMRSAAAFGPLVLTPSPFMRSQPANQQTEAMLQIGDRKYREANREIQARLKAAGHDVGSIDGLIGNGTRGKISAWQTANSLPPTGYFNALQLQLLTVQTEATYAQVLAAAPAPTTQKSSSSSSRSSSSSSRSSSSSGLGKDVKDTLNSFVHGLGVGLGSR